MLSQDTIYESLKQIYDPEVGINIVDMGLIYGLDIDDQKIGVTMTLTSPGCPAGPQILGQIDSALKALEGVEDVDIQVVWSPPWTPDMLSEEARDQLGIF
jgi:metal-sulfur cluster biosynthetic enzyme